MAVPYFIIERRRKQDLEKKKRGSCNNNSKWDPVGKRVKKK